MDIDSVTMAQTAEVKEDASIALTKLSIEASEHAAMYLIEKFAQTISQIYAEMGIGKNVDYSA